MSLLNLEDGLTQLRINDKTSKIDLRDSTPVLRETLQQMLHPEEEMSPLDLNEEGPDSPASDSEEGEYLSAVKEGPPRKKARRNPTLSERTPTPHPDVRIPEPTKEDEDPELSLYKELKKPKIIRDIPGFIIFKEHTKEEHQILEELIGDIQNSYEGFWKDIIKEVNVQTNLTPEARITLIQELIEDHNNHLDTNLDHVAQMFKRGRLVPKDSARYSLDKENNIHDYLRAAREEYFERAILSAQETNWLEQAKAKGKAYQESIDGPELKPIPVANRYAIDYQNARHATISSHHCVHQTCVTHYSDKYGTGY
jgi:hypothetical protein